MKAMEAGEHFAFDDRLGIPVPKLLKDWDELTTDEQADIIYYWETVRGWIPDRILIFEQEIMELQRMADEEDCFDTVCRLTWDIAERASRINDLNLYFRLDQDVAVKTHH